MHGANMKIVIELAHQLMHIYKIVYIKTFKISEYILKM